MPLLVHLPIKLVNFCKKSNNCLLIRSQQKHIRRELITKDIKDCARKINDNPNLSSHSFRVGFITELWRDTNDIEFVRQAIGHAKIDTTSQYVENLSEKERQDRMLEISVDKVKSEVKI